MVYEVWVDSVDESEVTQVSVFPSTPEPPALYVQTVDGEPMVHSHSILADSWDEAMAVHYANSGFAPYVPME